MKKREIPKPTATESRDTDALDVEICDEDLEGAVSDDNYEPYTMNNGYDEDENDADTQFNHGELCRNGQGVAQDYAKAAAWYRKAARQNHAMAQSNLGVLYEKGLGIRRSYKKAAAWYRKSAEQGEPTAQFNIGNAYEFGRGMQQDYTQAADWYIKAAKQGHADAQVSLGYLCDQGLGVRMSHADAYFWLSIAVPQIKRKLQRKVKRELQVIETKLRPEQLSKAKKRVKQHKEAKVKEEIREAKQSMKELAQYVVVLNKEQIKIQGDLEKAQRHLTLLQKRLAAS